VSPSPPSILQKALGWLSRPFQTSDKLFTLCRGLVQAGKIREAIPLLVRLSGDSAYGRDARHLLLVCKQLRRSGLLDETVNLKGLLDDVAHAHSQPLEEGFESVLIRARKGAGTTLIVFLPPDGEFWVTLSLLHHYLREFPVNLVYVRDDSGRFHMAGHEGLGADYAGSVAGLREIVAQLGGHRLYCVGTSASGYAALRFGLDLGAESVLCFSPITTAIAEALGEHAEAAQGLIAAAPEMAVEIAALYRSAPQRPRATLIYGDGHATDRRLAHRMAGITGVDLVPLENYDRHDTLSFFLLNGRFELMFKLLEGPADDDAPLHLPRCA
jgi:hypothetical protein